jgi:hypothetical protein
MLKNGLQFLAIVFPWENNDWETGAGVEIIDKYERVVTDLMKDFTLHMHLDPTDQPHYYGTAINNNGKERILMPIRFENETRKR